MDNETKAAMRETSRRRMREIWEQSSADEAQLNDEEQGLLAAMRLHPEYYQLWDRLDELSSEELEQDGTNPILHITMHQIIETQIAKDDPPETDETLNRLMAQGTTRHDAIHQIGAVFTEELYQVLKHQREFNSARYIKKLGRLGKQRKIFKGRRKGRN
jgi:hypothetical protein